MPFRFPSFVTTVFSGTLQESRADDVPDVQNQEAAPASADERRIHQRFVARLNGEPCFWALIGGERLALNDLSLHGFALPAMPSLAPGAQFDFTLQRMGVPDAIVGRAEVTAIFGKPSASAGCRINRFEGDGEERLQDWLVTHVIRSATVRISEKDAAAIVSGRSLI